MVQTRQPKGKENAHMQAMSRDLRKTFAARMEKIIEEEGFEFFSRNMISSMLINFTSIIVTALPSGDTKEKERIIKRVTKGLEFVMRQEWGIK